MIHFAKMADRNDFNNDAILVICINNIFSVIFNHNHYSATIKNTNEDYLFLQIGLALGYIAFVIVSYIIGNPDFLQEVQLCTSF